MCIQYFRLFLGSAPSRNPTPAPKGLHGSANSRDRMYEVSVDPYFQVPPGPATREIRRTINLPKECSMSHCNILFTKKNQVSCKRLFTAFLGQEVFSSHTLSTQPVK